MPQHPHDSRGLRSTSHPPHAGEPLHAFDVLLVPASGLPVADEERQAHPPVRRPSVRLADGLNIGVFDGDFAELVMNACEFRGHFYFTTANRPGGRYAYVLDQPVTAAFTSGWDPDELIRLAVALSRYVRDNADSGQYAARVTEYSGGEVRIMPYDCTELRHVYRMGEEERDWLDEREAEELAELISAFRAIGELPERVGQAFWKVEHTAWERYLDVVQPAMVSALEGLLSTSREQLTRQFVTRVPLVAVELGIAGVSKTFCRRMYDARSQGVHGRGIDLFQPGARRSDAVRQVALLQAVLRAIVRRAIEDPVFRSVFDDDANVRQRWPVEVPHRRWRWRRIRI